MGLFQQPFKNALEIIVRIIELTAKYDNIAIHAGLYRANKIFLSCEVWRMFSVSASIYVVTCMWYFSIDVLIRTLSDECSLEVFKLTIKVCHSAQNILPLPIPAKHKK